LIDDDAYLRECLGYAKQQRLELGNAMKASIQGDTPLVTDKSGRGETGTFKSVDDRLH
jgi:hypothetical protein